MSHPIKNSTQLAWGAGLIIVGIAVFFRIPQVMPRLAEMGQSSATLGFARICLYLMGIILIGGGMKKIFNVVSTKAGATNETASGPDEQGSDR